MGLCLTFQPKSWLIRKETTLCCKFRPRDDLSSGFLKSLKQRQPLICYNRGPTKNRVIFKMKQFMYTPMEKSVRLILIRKNRISLLLCRISGFFFHVSPDFLFLGVGRSVGRAKELPGCSVPHRLIAYIWELEILVTTLNISNGSIKNDFT